MRRSIQALLVAATMVSCVRRDAPPDPCTIDLQACLQSRRPPPSCVLTGGPGYDAKGRTQNWQLSCTGYRHVIDLGSNCSTDIHRELLSLTYMETAEGMQYQIRKQPDEFYCAHGVLVEHGASTSTSAP